MSLPSNEPLFSRRIAVRFGGAGLAAALATPVIGSARARDLSTLEANKAIVRRLFDIGVNARDLAQAVALYAPDHVDDVAGVPQLPRLAGMPVSFQEFQAVFPDVTVTVDAIVAEEDLVATRGTWRGAHPPAGTHVAGETMHFFRIANGQIVEQWSTGWEWLSQRGEQLERLPSNPLAIP